MKKTKGFSLVEVVVGCSIVTLVGVTIIGAIAQSSYLSNRSLYSAQSAFLLEEGIEAVKTIRNAGWTNISSLSTTTNYYLSFDTNTNTWSLLTTNPGLISSKYTRVVTVANVYRDSNSDIVSSGGTLDDGTRLVTISVSWKEGGQTTTKTLSSYVAQII